MSAMEAVTLDMSAILQQAYELGDFINSSAEVAEYLYWKQQLEQDPEAQALIKLFAKKKELFEECQRFGRYHPDYNRAREEVEKVREQLDRLEVVRNFKRAEETLDEILHEVSTIIAHAVSEQIIVPGNNPFPAGCGAGGKCRCG